MKYLAGFLALLVFSYCVHWTILQRATDTGIVYHNGQKYHLIPWDGENP